MKSLIKKTLSVVFILILALAMFSVCAFAEEEGTPDNPWFVGKTAGVDDVYAYIDEYNDLQIIGDGAMMDFENLEDRPWNDRASDITEIYITDTVTSIGKNAFNSVGGADLYLIYLGEGIVNIDDYAFYNCPYAVVIFPQSVDTIGSNAFCSTNEVDQIEYKFEGKPSSIASDAFADTNNVIFYVKNSDNWTNAEKLSYGATDYTYYRYFTVTTECYYNDELLESYEDDAYEDDIFIAYASPVINEEYVFETWAENSEVEGLDDLTNNSAEIRVSSDVQLVANYIYDSNYCHLKLTKKDGTLAEEGKDYTWNKAENKLTVHTSGLTIAPKQNIFSNESQIITDASVNKLTLDNIFTLPIEDIDFPIMYFGGNIHLIIKGNVSICGGNAPIIFADGKIKISSDGLFIATNNMLTEKVYPVILAKDIEFEGVKTGSFGFSFSTETFEEDTEEIVVKTWEEDTNYKTLYDKESGELTANLICMAEEESPETGDNILTVAFVGLISAICAAFVLRRKEN